MNQMKYLTAATITVALGVALVGCGSDKKSSPSTSASTSASGSTPATSPATSATPGVQRHKTIDDYITENHITVTPVHQGDPGSPTINLPVPPGWKISDNANTSYGAIVLAQPANPADPPTIAAIVSKLTGDVDPAKIIQYAPGTLENLPGYAGNGDGTASTLAGFQAWQLNGTYTKDNTKRAAAQKIVVIPSQGATLVLELDADSAASDQGPLMDGANVIDAQTTITP
jgi:Probable lipoprotein LpqN